MDFGKFQENYILKVKGIDRAVIEDSFENGEGEYICSTTPDFLDDTFTIPSKNMDIEYIQKIIMTHLKEQLGCSELSQNWLHIQDSDGFLLTLNEVGCCNSYSRYCPDMQKAEKKGKQVYACHYLIKLFINNKKVTSKDLQEIFPMCDCN